MPEDPADARLAKLLVPAPYVVPEKKATGTRKSARRQEVSGSSSDGSKEHSSCEDKEEEEETSPPPVGGEKKRKVALTGEAEGSKKGKTLPLDYYTNADDSGEEWPLWAKPLVKSYVSGYQVIHSIRLLHSFPLCRICLCSPPKDRLDASSSGTLDSSDVNSLLTATSPRPTDDTEVLSQ